MSKVIKSYMPECLLTNEKHGMSVRCTIEELAIVDTSGGYRVAACRGKDVWIGDDLSVAWGIAGQELAFLERVLPQNRCVCLQSDSGPILFFGALLDTSGLILAVHPRMSASAFLHVLRYLRISNIAVSPAVQEAGWSLTSFDEGECEQIAALFYYTDRILDPDRRYRLGFWSKCLLIAKFTGCALDETLLSVEPPALSASDTDRLIAFLLCTMLELRGMSGHVSAQNENVPSFSCRMELEDADLPSVPQRGGDEAFSFLRIPAFSDFFLRQERGKLVLDAFLHERSESSSLRSLLLRPLHLRIEFLSSRL